MFDKLLRFVLIAVVALALTACGKKEAAQAGGAAAISFGKEDAECFAGLVRESDAKHVSKAAFGEWKDRLGDKDKEWLGNFSASYLNVTRIVTSHLGKTPEELHDAGLVDDKQVGMIKGYEAVILERDAAKADAMAASACASIGFSKGLNFN